MTSRSPVADAMDDAETMRLLSAETPFARARREFASSAALIEQAAGQRRPPSPVELRRMEFAAVERIVAAFGYRIDPETGRTLPDF